MKNIIPKRHSILDQLVEINVYREDCYLYSKVVVFEQQRQGRAKIYNELYRLQDSRKSIQTRLIDSIESITIDDWWKNYLFVFVNKIYKIIKMFHHKLVIFCPKMAEIVQSNAFLQQLRMLSIQMLNDHNNIKSFLSTFTTEIRKRHLKELNSVANSNGNSKYYQHLRKEDNLKNDKYLALIRQNEVDLFLKSHQRVMTKIELQINSVLDKPLRDISVYPICRSKEIVNISCDHLSNHVYHLQSSFMHTYSYKQQGFCQFILSKWNRMLKDLKDKNLDNNKHIIKFSEKYREHFGRTIKTSFPKSIRINSRENKPNITKQTILNQQYIDNKSSIIVNNDKSYKLQEMQPSHEIINEKQIKDMTLQDKQNIRYEKKANFGRIQKLSNQQRSFALRPLTDNKQYIHQAIIEMKLQQKHLVSKVLRIRKKKHLFSRKQDSQFIVQKEEKSKISIYLN